MEKLKIVINVLKSMGYSPELNTEKRNINFRSPGFDNFNNKQTAIIRAILGPNLNEFFYGHDTQYIYYKGI